jgi:hypothetical protein
MSWEFDHHKVMIVLAEIIEDMVGEHLSDMPEGGGMKSVFLSHYGNIQPPLPFITLTYNGSNDNDGYTIDSGLVDVQIEDPDNPSALITVTTPYEDKVTNFNISLRAESLPAQTIDDKGNANRLLREIRKGLMLPKYRKRLHEEVFTAIEFINTIRSTPDLIATDYHDICTMQLKLSSIDRLIDYDALSFDTVKWDAEIKLDAQDPNPLIIQGSTTSSVP